MGDAETQAAGSARESGLWGTPPGWTCLYVFVQQRRHVREAKWKGVAGCGKAGSYWAAVGSRGLVTRQAPGRAGREQNEAAEAGGRLRAPARQRTVGTCRRRREVWVLHVLFLLGPESLVPASPHVRGPCAPGWGVAA